jgi:PAS domain S-box-containing protein
MSEEGAHRLSELFSEAGLLDRLGESIPGLVYVYDLVEQSNVFANRPLTELLGYSPEQVHALGNRMLVSVVHPDDLDKVRAHHEVLRTVADGQVLEIEYRVRSPHGAVRWLHSWESALTRDASGRTRRFLGIAHDVTARVRVEEELRSSERRLFESEQRWRSIAENPFDFCIVIDRNYRYTFVNHVAPGLEMEALIGKATPFDFVSKDDHPAMQAAFDTAFNEGRAASYDVYVPSLGKWYASLVGPIRDGDVVTHVSVLTRDITTEKRIQEQAKRTQEQLRAMEFKLAQSAKLEAVGQLAGGIAHDFNNLLTSVAAVADILTHRLRPDHDALADLDELRQVVTRGTGLTRQLLAFSRQQPVTLVAVELNDILDETARMLRRLIRENIELEIQLPQEKLAVRGDRSQIEQVLMNLTLNARDAMPDGGRLEVSMAATELGDDARQMHPDARTGSYVCLSVRDSGSGMDDATLRRIFEPFFTTKPIGAGTGLGLSLVHGIVQQSGGFIQVHSAPGQGSTFEIYLPRSEPGRTERTSAPGSRRGGDELILLVEDNTIAQRVTRRLLELLGYRVECAERGDDALRLIESGLQFDLLLTDILLPGLDGNTLFRRASRLRPGLPAVLMSGYTADVLVEQHADEPMVARLQKPFSHDELAEKVRAALDGRAHSWT